MVNTLALACCLFPFNAGPAKTHFFHKIVSLLGETAGIKSQPKSFAEKASLIRANAFYPSSVRRSNRKRHKRSGFERTFQEKLAGE